MVIVFTKCDWRSAGCADSMILGGLARVSKHGTSQTQRLTHNKDGDMIQRRQLIGHLAAAPLLACLPARAQSYPDKPIRMIVPLPPGSPPDVLARHLADAVSRNWKQTVIVENRPGATGMIGLQALSRSAPDGYTMGVMFLTHTVLPELIGPLPYNTATDFAPIANLVWLYNVLVVPASSSIQTLQDLVNRARAEPNALNYGSGGNGSPAHLVAESFCQASNVKMTHQPTAPERPVQRAHTGRGGRVRGGAQGMGRSGRTGRHTQSHHRQMEPGVVPGAGFERAARQAGRSGHVGGPAPPQQ